jgi:hypothetical protein
MLVQDVLAAFEHDLKRTGKVSLKVIEGPNLNFVEGQSTDDPYSELVWLASESGVCTGVVITLNINDSEQLALVAEQIQKHVHEELSYLKIPVLWPECPIHRKSHPLDPISSDDEAWWICPKNQARVARIGELMK